MQETPNKLLKSVFLPGWIYQALIRHKRSVTDLTNYGVVRSIMSLSDIADWKFVNDRLQIDGMYLSDAPMIDLFSSLTKEEREEINVSVAPLSDSEENASSVKSRLTTKDAGFACVADEDYSFVLADNTIYVILNPGFLTMCNDRSKYLEFLQNYLKKCYVMTSIPDVSNMAVYKAYVHYLAN